MHLRKNFVLIDFENVQPESLEALRAEHFKVIVFVGATQGKVSVDIAMALQSMGSNAEYVKIASNGKNALDFHIAYYIGKLVAQDPTAYFHVISKDTGFDPLIQHLKTQKVLAARVPDIESISMLKQVDTKSPSERAQVYITKLRDPKVTRPRAVKTLTSSIGSFFQKQLSESDVQAVVQELQNVGFVSVEGNKVVYA
jgi:hypothetical protein